MCVALSLLSLSPITIGLAHYTSSTRVYAAQVMWTATPDLEDPTHPSHMTVSKALYIADRIFGMETSPEAYKYEMTRFAKVSDGRTSACDTAKRGTPARTAGEERQNALLKRRSQNALHSKAALQLNTQRAARNAQRASHNAYQRPKTRHERPKTRYSRTKHAVCV